MTTVATPIRLLRRAEPSTRSATLHPRLARGGSACRVLTTFDMLAAIDQAPAPIAAAQALASLSAAVDHAIAQGQAA